MKIPRYERTQGIQTGRLNALIDETPADVKAIRQFGAGAQEAGQDFSESLLHIQEQRDKIEEMRHGYAFERQIDKHLREKVLTLEGDKANEITEKTLPELDRIRDEYMSENVSPRLQGRARLRLDKIVAAAADKTTEHEVLQIRKALHQAITDAKIFTRAQLQDVYNVSEANTKIAEYDEQMAELGATEEVRAVNKAQLVIGSVNSFCDKGMYAEATAMVEVHRKALQSVGMAEAAETDIIQSRHRKKAEYLLATEEARRKTNNHFTELYTKGQLTATMINLSNLEPVGEAGSKMWWLGKIKQGGGAGSKTNRKYRNELVNRILVDPDSVTTWEIIDANADGYLSQKDFTAVKKLHADELKNTNSPRRASLKVVQRSIKDLRDNGLLGKGVEAELLEQKLTEDLHTWYKDNPKEMPSEWFAEVSKEYYSNGVKEFFGVFAKPDITKGLADRQAAEPKKEQSLKEYREELAEADYQKWKAERIATLKKDGKDPDAYTDAQFRLFFKQRNAKK